LLSTRSAQTLYAYLQTQKPHCTAWLDARDVLLVQSDAAAGLGEKGSTSSTTGVTPLWAETAELMDAWWEEHRGELFGGADQNDDENGNGNEPVADEAPILIVTGFVAKVRVPNSHLYPGSP